MEPLAGLLVASFLASTLLPLPSEAALFAYLRLHPDKVVLALAVATIGNTAGGMTSYWVGRLFPQKRTDRKAISALQRRGAPALLLAWLPFIGDALCVAAGWLRVNWLAALGFMAVGRLARYAVVAAFA